MRKLLSAILLTVMLFTFTACHGTPAGETPQDTGFKSYSVPSELSGEPIEITFWSKNDSNITQKTIYENAIASFEELYPNIKINLKTYTNYGDIYNDVIKNLPTNTTPNVCITYPDHIATYTTGADTVVPLDDLINDEKFGLGGSLLKFDGPNRDEIVPKFLEECKINSNYFARPFMRSTEACYINRDLVEKLGYEVPEILTWDFIFEVSERAMEKNTDGTFKLNGQKTLIPFIYKSTDNMMIQMLKQKGAGYSTENGEVLIFNDDTREILGTVYDAAESKSFSTFSISSYPGNFLNAGQCIFAIDSTAGATWMGSHAPLVDISPDKLVEFETVVRPIPQFDTENPTMISQGPSICIFNKESSQEVLASWLFVQYLLTDEVQISYSQTEGYSPVTLKAQRNENYIDYLSRSGEDNSLYYNVKIEATKLLIANTENTFVTPVFNGSTSLRNAAGQLIEKVTKSARRKESFDGAYLDKLFSDIETLYHLDEIKPADGENGADIPNAEEKGLPTGSVVLIASLLTAWVCIGAYFVIDKLRARRFSKKR